MHERQKGLKEQNKVQRMQHLFKGSPPQFDKWNRMFSPKGNIPLMSAAD